MVLPLIRKELRQFLTGVNPVTGRNEILSFAPRNPKHQVPDPEPDNVDQRACGKQDFVMV